MPLTALSISRPVIHSMEAALRSDSPSTWQVLAVLERACYLVSPAGDLMALVLGEIGDGPLNVVVAATPGAFGRLTTGMACDLSARGLRLGNIAVDLAAAQIWEPRPDWHRLRDRLAQVQRLLGELRTVAHRSAPAGSLLSLLSGCARSHDRLEESVRLAARQAGDALRAGWSGDERHRQMAAAQLAGLGQGLTPAGDDFLAGAMLWAWLAHPAPEGFCQALLKVAAPRTTALSLAFLRAAARGECSAAWHGLLNQLAAPEDAAPSPSTALSGVLNQVLSCGHTSGADTLAGFLWIGSRARQ
jgi:hypothetical protein